MRQVLVYAIVTVVVVVSVAAWAQPALGPGTAPATRASPRQDPQQQAQGFMSMWNPQVMIDRSVKQATSRYKLTPEQEELARKMTTDGVNAFLDKHEAQIRSLLLEAVEARMAGEPPAPDKVRDWARRAAPLFEEGQKAILDGNQQFRDCLSEEQKKIFDADQKILQQQVAFARERLTNWTEGRFNPETDWFTPRPRPPAVTQPSQPNIDRWDLYVRGFINRYKLDDAQTAQAMAILADTKNRATEYYYSSKADIEAANQRLKELLADPALKEQSAEARKHLEDLNRPIDGLYAEMQQRLNQIPTDQQRKAYEAERQARRERFRDRIRRTDTNTAISATSQSQPGASQLALNPGSRPAAAASQPASAASRSAGVGGRSAATRSVAGSQPVRGRRAGATTQPSPAETPAAGQPVSSPGLQ